MSEMMKLAEIVEGLEGPCRETDVDIHEAIGHVVDRGCPAEWHGDDETPRYTASLDAAMQLVPDWYVWTMHTFPDKSSCFLMKGDYKMIRPENQFQATPALALVSAALKARAHLEGE
ncbi:hypothetical protein [Sphingobium sp. HDIP04]|uniref:hypothetical protein n=1 Tax=Sphingobium sp. HDIP04 TaxID=428994 RepID=UPI0003877867|nr:hypothetical protein [Sphingobium sp. HDIP04]EQB03936.1 hypothetical protein L286_11275 [Sphingobium sp. HDIP04]